jgi:Leucine-rich repeat (LRR) protein
MEQLSAKKKDLLRMIFVALMITSLINCKSGQELSYISSKIIDEAKETNTLKIINDNRYSDMPKEIFRLTNLRELVFIGTDCDFNKSQCKNITVIPKKIKFLSNLEELKLVMNNIKTIPIELNNLKKLKSLDLSNNSSIDVTNLNIQSLEVLNLNDCNLSKLPENLKNMKNLKRLGIEGNFNLRVEEIDNLKYLLPNCKIYFN